MVFPKNGYLCLANKFAPPSTIHKKKNKQPNSQERRHRPDASKRAPASFIVQSRNVKNTKNMAENEKNQNFAWKTIPKNAGWYKVRVVGAKHLSIHKNLYIYTKSPCFGTTCHLPLKKGQPAKKKRRLYFCSSGQPPCPSSTNPGFKPTNRSNLL